MTALSSATSAPPSAVERWRRLPRRWRLLLIAMAAIVTLYFASSLVAGIYQSPSSTPTGYSSSEDASPVGTEAMAKLLAARHHPVQSLTVPLANAHLPTNGTLFVLDPAASLTPSAAALEDFVGNGGRLVLGGHIATAVLHDLLSATPVPVWQPVAAGDAHPVEHTAADVDVTTVLGTGGGSWQLPSGARPSVLLQGPAGALALDATVGRGTLVLLASSAPLQNRQLAQVDDAAFALDLSGPAGAPVLFDEYDHGLGRAGTGLAGLPSHWKAALLLGLLAALVWLWSAARRFGPPQRAERELIPARVLHVDAMASLLASGKTERAAAAAAPLREQGRAALQRRLRAGPEATDQQLAELAASSSFPSLTPQLVADLLDAPRSESDLVAEGRAFVALGSEGPLR